MTVEPSRPIIAAVNDLMFASKIRGAAQQLGATVEFVRSADALLAAAATARLILLDLDTRWLDVPDMIRTLKGDAATSGAHVVVFGSHVEGEALMAARTAGADRVLARSGFVKVLPELLVG